MVQLEAYCEVADLLEALLVRLKPIQSRRGGVALGLWGDAGIGKTHTARALLAQVGCRGLALHGSAPIKQWLQVLPTVDTLPMWAERVLERLRQGEHVSPEASADALITLLGALAPVAVHLEDLHEASPEQAELIGLLAQGVQQTSGVGLIVTSRTQPPAPFEVHRLEPLGFAATQQVLEGELGTALPSEAIRWIFERSRGNPLFTLEYLRYLTRGGYIWSDGRRWNWRSPPQGLLPVTVEALIERLIGEVRSLQGVGEVLEARAILPGSVEAQVWAKVSGLAEAEFESASRALQQRGLLRGEQFAHPLFREVTAHTLSPSRRQELARRAIEALQEDAVVAAGLIEEARLEPNAARQLLAQGVEAAKANKNPVQAARLLGQMVGYSEAATRAQTALEAAEALKTIDVGEAARFAMMAAEWPPYREAALYLQAELEAIQGRLKEAERLCSQVGFSDYWTRLLKLRGSAMDYSGVLEILAEHPEVLERPDAETAHRAARAYAQNGRIGEAEELVSQALSEPGLSQADRALLLRASSQIALMKSDYASAEGLEAQIQTLAREMGNLRLLDQALFNRALALEGLERYRECMGQLEQAMEVCRELGDRTALVIAQVAYARHLFEFAEYEQAEGLLLEARDHLIRLDPSVYLLDCQVALSTLYREWQPSHGALLALKHARAALEAAQQIKNPRNLVAALHNLSLAEASHSPEQARFWAEQAQKTADGITLQEAQFLALWSRASAHEASHQTAEALRLYREAQQISHASGSPLEHHKLGVKIAQLSRNLELAREHLGWLEARGLQHSVQMALRSMPELSAQDGSDPVASQTQALTLEVLGPMRFCQDGVHQMVRGQKRQELLALLLEARLMGRSEVGRLELLDLLYPGIEEEQAARSLKSTVHVIRASFGQNLIQTSPQGYALGSLQTDVEMFLQTGDTRLWHGTYLEGVGGERSEVVQLQIQERLKAALVPMPDLTERLRLAKILVALDPYQLESWRILLQTLRQSENYRSLNRSYQECRGYMEEVGEVLPEEWQNFLGQLSG